MSKRRVVITGMGAVTPLGIGVETTWKNAMAGVSGTRRIQSFDPAEYYSHVAGEVQGFDANSFLNPKDQKKMDRFIQFGILAADEAIAQAGLKDVQDDALLNRIGVLLGSGIGGLREIEETHKTMMERGPRRVSPFFIPAILINLLSGQVSIRYKFRGPNSSVVTACATGAHAIGDAMKLIRRGAADVMVAGGAEACVCPLAVAGFGSMRALSSAYNETPEKASRPFDKDRDGFVIAEGAGVVVLEEYEHAKKRGATIIAEVAGYGMSGDGWNMTISPEDGIGQKLAIQSALADAEITADQVQYVNAHATSTPAGDEIESQVLEAVFGPKIVLSATKSMTGHMLGAAGGVEAIFTALSVSRDEVPPTINLQSPSDNCRLDYVPHTGRQMKVQAALNNSFGFGTTNAALVFKKV